VVAGQDIECFLACLELLLQKTEALAARQTPLVIERGGPDMWYLPQVYGLHEAPDLEP
jgi:hypothetical protein